MKGKRMNEEELGEIEVGKERICGVEATIALS